MTRAKAYLALAAVVLAATTLWAVAPTGWTLTTSSTGDSSGCITTGSTNGLCAVAATTGNQLWLWLNGGVPVELYPASGGAAPTLTIGTVTTLPAGSQATASITGASPNFVLNLGLTTGNTGGAGSPGPPGPTWSSCTGASISGTGLNITGTLAVVPTQCK